MNLLLDTCTFLWIVLEPGKLSARASQLFTDRSNTCFLSSVSAWEIAVKYGLGKLVLVDPPASFVPTQRAQHGITSLPLLESQAARVADLPPLHKDPFDRMLICQALDLGWTILTPDPEIRRYPSVATDW
jgi:PIN domain nuclease of toxin-antitoxin system